MTHRSLQLTLVVLAFSAASAGFGFLGGLAGASLRAPAPPPPAYWPPPPPPGPPPLVTCPACPACPADLLPAPLRRGVLYSVSGLPAWGGGYEAARLADGDPATYWCSPASPTLPLSATLVFEAPAFVEALEIDNRLSGYETSGAREVRIEALDLGGAPLRSTSVVLEAGSVTTVPLSLAVVASGLRVTVVSTFGGDYAGIAEIVVHGSPAR